MSKIIKHEKYSDLISLIKKYSKPILILGPVGCGRSTAVKQVAEELKQELYYLGSVTDKKDFIGIDNENAKDVPSNFLLAYIKGGILFVDDVAKRSSDIIKQLIDLIKKDSLSVNKKKLNKHKDFKVVLSCDNENDLIVKYIEKQFVNKQEVEVIKFEYDLNLEKSICDDEEFYKFFTEVRKFSSDSICSGATTTALNKCVKLLNTNVFTPEDIIESLLIKGYNSGTLTELYESCKHLSLKNKYVLALKNIETLEN